MAGLLESFGQGLQGAGAILSEHVYDTQAKERSNLLPDMMRALEIKKAQEGLRADQDFTAAIKEAGAGMQPSALSTSAGQMELLAKVPMDLVARSSYAQKMIPMIGLQQKREADAQAQKDAALARKDAAEQRAYEHYDKMGQRIIEFERESTRKESSDRDRAEAALRLVEAKNERTRMEAFFRQQGIDVQRFNAETRRDLAAAGGRPPVGYERDPDRPGALRAIEGGPADTRAKDKKEKIDAPVQDLVADIDQAIKMIQDTPGVSGARGMFSRGKELVTTTLSGDTNTPANDFQSQLLQIQSKWRKLPTVAANRFKADAGKIDASIKGLGIGSNDAITVNNLTQLRENLVRGLEARSGEAPTAEPIAAPSVKSAVEAAGQTYEPAKYDYRIVDGKVQRKQK